MVRIHTISFFLICSLAALFFLGCEYVDKPEKNSDGPLSLKVPEGMSAPSYHEPLENWSVRHMDWLKKGFVKTATGEQQKITLPECLGCHSEPDNFCNNCHRYVGVKSIETKEKKEKGEEHASH